MELGLISILLLIPLIAAVIDYAGGVKSPKFAKYFAILTTTVVFIYSMYFLMVFDPTIGGMQLIETYQWMPALGLYFSVGLDGISLPLLLLGTFMTMIATAASPWMIHHHEAEYYGLMLLFEVGLLGVFVSTNLVLFYVFWELVLVPMFFMIAIWGGPTRKYAAMKFFIFTHVGSVLMLVSIMGFYLFSTPHTFNMLQLANVFPADLQFWLALGIFFGAAFKLPAVPFHTWLPDAHVQAPSPASVLLAGVLLKMGGYAFIRLGIGLVPQGMLQLAPFLAILGVIGIFYAAYAAMGQKDMKKLIAFSSINHMSFVLLGVAAGTVMGIVGAVFQMVSHGVIIGMLFLIAGIIQHHAGTRDIPVLKGLNNYVPKLSLLLIFASFASFAAPPLSGFIAELTVLIAALVVFPQIWITVFGAAVTTGLFLWLIIRTIYSEPDESSVKVSPVSKWELLPVAILVIPIVLLGLFPGLLFELIKATAGLLAFR